MINDPYLAAKETAEFLQKRAPAPTMAVVLGSGLGALADRLEDATTIDYGELPYFLKAGVSGHAGRLVVGKLPNGGPRIAALAGRVHLYEGHDIAQVVHPVRAMRLWGCKGLLLTNAAGAINPDYTPGELMRITDHLNLTGLNPLRGYNDDRLGVRFPDMSHAYDLELGACFDTVAKSLGESLRTGVYVGLCGPSYETPAEIRMFHTLGADAVGMSTVCETIAAHHVGLRVCGLSCITNMAAGLGKTALDHAEVKATATLARSRFLALVEQGLTEATTLLA